MNMILATLLICLSLCTNLHSKRSLIYDSDGNIDDLLAFMFIKELNEFDLLAVTTTGNGRCHSDFVGQNILDFLSQIGMRDIELSDKSSTSLSCVGSYPRNDRTLCDNLSYISLKKSNQKTSTVISHQLMINKINTSTNPVTIICSGPLTNLGLALLTCPSIKKKIDHVYIIGGAITVPGNIQRAFNGSVNVSAEYNIALDVRATQIVLNSGLPVTLIPLDLTHQLESLKSMIEASTKNQSKCLNTQIILSLLKPKFFPNIQSAITFSSIFAVLHVLNSKIGSEVPMKLQVNTVNGPQYGQLLTCLQGANVGVCINANKSEFLELFFENLSSH